MKDGYDPIKIERVDIKEWLKQDPDNILIIINGINVKHREICIKKSYFLNPAPNSIFKFCSIKNNALMITETINSPDYIELGEYLGTYLLVHWKSFIKVLKPKSNRAFSLNPGIIGPTLDEFDMPMTPTPGSIATIKHNKQFYHIEVPMPPPSGAILPKMVYKDVHPTFISKEKLELTQIGLKKLTVKMKMSSVKSEIPMPKISDAEYQLLKDKINDPNGTGRAAIIKKMFLYFQEYAAIYPNGKEYNVLFTLKDLNDLDTAVAGVPLDAQIFVNTFDHNIPYEEQVYFDKVLASALYDYSLIDGWDSAMNTYLRVGEDYFKTPAFLHNLKVYGDPKYYDNVTEIADSFKSSNINVAKKLLDKYKVDFHLLASPEEIYDKVYNLLDTVRKLSIQYGINKVKEKIVAIDKCFLEFAPRVTTHMTTKKYYRGMTGKYGHTGIGDTILLKNFTSISPNIEVAKGFGLFKTTAATLDNGKACCLFEITLTEGMPYINMINTTKFKSEAEILLPRDIRATLTKITKGSNIKVRVRLPNKTIETRIYPSDIYHITVTMKSKDQFKIDTGCNDFVVGQLEKIKLKDLFSTKLTTKQKKPVEEGIIQMVPHNVEKNLDEDLPKLKVPRCPNGMRRDKKTKKCVKKESKKTKTKTKSKTKSKTKTKTKSKTKSNMKSKTKSKTKTKTKSKTKTLNKTMTGKKAIKKGKIVLTKKQQAAIKPVKTQKCKGLSEEVCIQTQGCKYAKGAKRSFCRKGVNNT